MITLTYPDSYPRDGEVVKKHLKTMRTWLQRHGCEQGVWMLEFQERSAPHFHLFTYSAPAAQAVSSQWFKIVGSGDPEHLRASTRVERLRKPYVAESYAAKARSKKEQKQVPDCFQNVGRMWGKWGLKPFETHNLDWDTGVSITRALRSKVRADQRGRRWQLHDTGVVGFMAVGASAIAQRLLDRQARERAVEQRSQAVDADSSRPKGSTFSRIPEGRIITAAAQGGVIAVCWGYRAYKSDHPLRIRSRRPEWTGSLILLDRSDPASSRLRARTQFTVPEIETDLRRSADRFFL